MTFEERTDHSAISIPRIMLAAPRSGSGKTLLTCGLLRLLQKRGMHPVSFKCGPDYIDPMFHRQILKVPSRNLDTFFCPDGGTGEILARALQSAYPSEKADITVIEGVMGYFDGTGKSGIEASSFDLAKQTQTPVILMIDAKGMGRSISALAGGFIDFELQNSSFRAELSDENLPSELSQIKGVFLNRISLGMFPVMKRWIEEDTGIPVIGYLPFDARLKLESRHLGLFMPEEIRDLEKKTDLLADTLSETLDLETLISIARTAPDLNTVIRRNISSSSIRHSGFEMFSDQEKSESDLTTGSENNVLYKDKGGLYHENLPGIKNSCARIAVAWDEAFRFYYEDNLDLLREAGAELVFFSPVHDHEMPEADGLLLGGGYPELHAEALSGNESMKESIRRFAKEGRPILAECGGFMYLQEYLEGKDGSLFPMCGVLPGTCRRRDRLVRFGYVELERNPACMDKDPRGKTESPEDTVFSSVSGRIRSGLTESPSGNRLDSETGFLLAGHRIRGHEFHYYDSTENGSACKAQKPGSDRSWPCMVVRGNIMAGFPHLYYRSDPAFAVNFVQRCSSFLKGEQA